MLTAQHLSARILCLPAHDRADEVAAATLAQLLEQKGFATLSFPMVGSSLNEALALIEAGRSDVVCVWGLSGDTLKAMTRFERTQPDRLSTSLAEAVAHVQELVRPKPEAELSSRLMET